MSFVKTTNDKIDQFVQQLDDAYNNVYNKDNNIIVQPKDKSLFEIINENGQIIFITAVTSIFLYNISQRYVVEKPLPWMY